MGRRKCGKCHLTKGEALATSGVVLVAGLFSKQHILSCAKEVCEIRLCAVPPRRTSIECKKFAENVGAVQKFDRACTTEEIFYAPSERRGGTFTTGCGET